MLKSNKEYPKVLIFSSTKSNNYTGTGLLLRNLFSDWPVEKLAYLTTNNIYGMPSTKEWYGMSQKEIRYVWPISSILKSRLSNNSSITETKNVKVSERRLFHGITRILGGEEILRKYVLTQKLIQWIDSFKPEVIYCHVSSINEIKIVNALILLFKIPLVIHIMDDWFTVKYKQGLFSFFFRKYFKNQYKKLMHKATIRMCISKKMSEEYNNRFGCEFVTFSNVIDTKLWFDFQIGKRQDAFFELLYAGTINDKNIKGLLLLSDIVEELNKEGQKINFKLYSFKEKLKYFGYMFNNHQSLSIGEVPKDDPGMMNILKNADLLVIPFDYSKKSIERIRLSMLAKVSAYLASGIPILVFGSEKIATVEYAIKEKWAHVLVNNNREQLKNMIIELIKNTELRNSTIKIAKKVVIKDFDAKIIKEDFRRQIQTTIIN